MLWKKNAIPIKITASRTNDPTKNNRYVSKRGAVFEFQNRGCLAWNRTLPGSRGRFRVPPAQAAGCQPYVQQCGPCCVIAIVVSGRHRYTVREYSRKAGSTHPMSFNEIVISTALRYMTLAFSPTWGIHRNHKEGFHICRTVVAVETRDTTVFARGA